MRHEAPAADPIFAEPRLAEIYDFLDPVRDDLDAYVRVVESLGARSVVDVGCGTGSFACLLVERGIQVVGVDPAVASLDVARRKPHADRVTWLMGDATSLPALHVDVATMTANVAQVFLTDEDWSSALRGVRAALKPGGQLVFETRDPTAAAWLQWTREKTSARTRVPGVGFVDSWCDVMSVVGPFVTFRWTYRFAADGAVLTSDSTLRFRSRAEVETSLAKAGYVVDDVRDAPDRPGQELVFVASRR